MRFLKVTGLLTLVFCISFLSVTALCDFICQHNGYYEAAAKDVVVLDD